MNSVIMNAAGARRQPVRIIGRQLSTPVADHEILGLVPGPAPGRGQGGGQDCGIGWGPVHNASAHARYLG